MVAGMVRQLEGYSASLLTWLGNRQEFELPAFAMSLAMHGVFLVGLAFAGFQVHREARREFRSQVLDNLMPSELTYQDLDQTTIPPAAVPAAGSFAPTLAPMITSVPSSAEGVPVSAQDGTRRRAPACPA